MGSPELNIELQRVSNKLTGSLILKSRGCPMGPPQLNIELRRVSNKLTVVLYLKSQRVSDGLTTVEY